MTRPDIIVPFLGVRPTKGEIGAGEELRFMLRSLRNVPHGRVFIAGGELPRWARNIVHVPVEQERKDKFTSQTRNLLAILTTHETTEEVVLFNDDFYVLNPVDEIPVMHTGRIRGTPGGNRLVRHLRSKGISSPVSYEGHFPLRVNAADFAHTLQTLPSDLHTWKRSVYGNLYNIGGVQVDNAKVLGQLPRGWRKRGYISSSDRAFIKWQRGPLSGLFDAPSPYEEGGAPSMSPGEEVHHA